jgi:hypothetical protein
MPYQESSMPGRLSWAGKLCGLGAVLGLLVLPAGKTASGQLLAPNMGVPMHDDGHKGKDEGSGDRAVRLLTLAPIPKTAANNTAGGLYSYDIAFVDQNTQTYYLADRSNNVVDVVNAKNGKFVKQISATPAFKGFTGSTSTSGPNGVVASYPWLFVTDGGSRVVNIDVRNDKTVGDVVTKTGDTLRADELAYDPDDGLLLVINNADTPPFGTLINVDKSTGKLTVGKTIIFDKTHGVDAQNGAEQPVWVPETNRFYLSIPQIGSNVADGGVIRINPFSATVEATYPVKYCSPAGLTVGPRKEENRDLFIGCNMVFDTKGNVWNPDGTVPADPRDVIIDAKTGSIDATVFGVGAGDEVWFNPGDGNYYATGSGSPLRPLSIPSTGTGSASTKGATPLGVVDAKDQKVVQLVTTYNVGAVTGTGAHPAGTAHSVAANSRNNLVFVALAANNAFLSPDAKYDCSTGCVAVFGHSDEDVDHDNE